MAVKLGYLDTIAVGLLGHKLGTMISRYTLLVSDTLIDAANRVSIYIARVMEIDIDVDE